jgi:Reverse transcriptase (RNA-dependent DNA polymerase)
MQEQIDFLLAYSTFNDEGQIKFLPGCNNIHLHFVFAVKHDIRHKAGLVAGDHLTDLNTTDSKYSGVVSLRSMRIAIAAGDMFMMVGEIASASLKAFTLEKVCVIAGPKFVQLEGHLLSIVRALYGLRTSRACWHDRFPDVMHLLGFSLSKADPGVCMHDCITHYECVIVYVDDIMFIGI